MKKKVLSVLMASVMAFAMTACGSNAQTTGTTTDSTESVESTTETEAETTESAAGDTTEGAALKIAIVSSPSRRGRWFFQRGQLQRYLKLHR